MARRDLLHKLVKEILILDGWTITHDPYILPYKPGWEIDLGAEKILAAERNAEQIAVEVKSFIADSFANEFHGILGQYLNYRSALKRTDIKRILFLAVPIEVYEWEFAIEGIANSVEDYNVRILVYDPIDKVVIKWIL
jgi:hypothetical protein